MNISQSQRKVLANLSRTSFYGQNQRTFGALYSKGLIRFATSDELSERTANQYRLTEKGHEAVR